MSMLNKACYVGAGAIAFMAASGSLSTSGSNSKKTKAASDDTIYANKTRIAENYGNTPAGGAGGGMAPTSTTNPDGTPGTPGGDGSVSGAMNSMVGQSTADVPYTDGGNYACAYAVNSAYQNATGNTITGAYGSGSNLSVADTLNAIQGMPNQFQAVDAQTAVSSGRDYIIVSNGSTGSNGSHIGVGNGTTVWSNSSSKAAISQNYTTSSWQNHFGGTQYYIINK